MDPDTREHQHSWVLSDLVIDTLPPQYTWFCACGLASHAADGSQLCGIKHYGQPALAALRTTKEGGG